MNSIFVQTVKSPIDMWKHILDEKQYANEQSRYSEHAFFDISRLFSRYAFEKTWVFPQSIVSPETKVDSIAWKKDGRYILYGIEKRNQAYLTQLKNLLCLRLFADGVEEKREDLAYISASMPEPRLGSKEQHISAIGRYLDLVKAVSTNAPDYDYTSLYALPESVDTPDYLPNEYFYEMYRIIPEGCVLVVSNLAGDIIKAGTIQEDICQEHFAFSVIHRETYHIVNWEQHFKKKLGLVQMLRVN